MYKKRIGACPNFTGMMRSLALLFLVLFIAGCKGTRKKPDVPTEQFFPVPAYLKGEVAALDSSLASFYKIETIDGKADTTPIRNDEVKKYAADFLAIPDISAPELKNDYQVTHDYDDMLGAFVFQFVTNEEHPVRREHVVLDPEQNSQGKNNIQSIFVEHWQRRNDTIFRKNMLWEAGRNFQVTTISEAGGAQKTKKLQVVWNGFEGQNR